VTSVGEIIKSVLPFGLSSSLPGLRVVLRAMFKKQLLLMIRYRVNFFFRLASMYLLFAVIFFGGKAATSRVGGEVSEFSSTFEGIIVGWFLLTMVQASYSSLHSNVTSESQWGTLEQLYMSPYGFGWIMALKNIVNVLFAVLWGVMMLILMMVTTWTWFIIDIFTIAPIIIFTILPVLGIGLVSAGLALIYKKIGGVNSIMQFVFIGLIAVPVTDQSLLQLLPVAQGSAMLQEAMRNGVKIWEFSLFELIILVVPGLIYYIIGYVVFRYCEHVARRKGVMGHY